METGSVLLDLHSNIIQGFDAFFDITLNTLFNQKQLSYRL